MSVKRDLSLKERKEKTRSKRPGEIIVFPLEEIKRHFDENIMQIDQQYAVASTLIEEGKRDAGENIWRSQIIFLDSAFDFYLHEITKFGLEKIFNGEWKKTEKYENFKVKLSYIERALDNPDDREWFKECINSEFSRVPMMAFDVVRDQLNMLGIDIQKVANEAFHTPGSREKTREKLKRRINELYDRRNLIAHQSDRQAHNAQREPISKEIVESFVEDIKKIVDSIHNVALENN